MGKIHSIQNNNKTIYPVTISDAVATYLNTLKWPRWKTLTESLNINSLDFGTILYSLDNQNVFNDHFQKPEDKEWFPCNGTTLTYKGETYQLPYIDKAFIHAPSDSLTSNEPIVHGVLCYRIADGELVDFENYNISIAPTDQYTPIAIRVIDTDDMYEGSKPRYMSLPIMSKEHPDKGSTYYLKNSDTLEDSDTIIPIMVWDTYESGTENSLIDPPILEFKEDGTIEPTYIYKTIFDAGHNSWYSIYSDGHSEYQYSYSNKKNDTILYINSNYKFIENTNFDFKIDYDTSKKLMYDNTINTLGTNLAIFPKIDGKMKSQALLNLVGDKENCNYFYEKNENIYYNYPGIAVTNKFYTEGTNAGDWYVPSLSEIFFYLINVKRVSEAFEYVKNINNNAYNCVLLNESDFKEGTRFQTSSFMFFDAADRTAYYTINNVGGSQPQFYNYNKNNPPYIKIYNQALIKAFYQLPDNEYIKITFYNNKYDTDISIYKEVYIKKGSKLSSISDIENPGLIKTITLSDNEKELNFMGWSELRNGTTIDLNISIYEDKSLYAIYELHYLTEAIGSEIAFYDLILNNIQVIDVDNWETVKDRAVPLAIRAYSNDSSNKDVTFMSVNNVMDERYYEGDDILDNNCRYYYGDEKVTAFDDTIVDNKCHIDISVYLFSNNHSTTEGPILKIDNLLNSTSASGTPNFGGETSQKHIFLAAKYQKDYANREIYKNEVIDKNGNTQYVLKTVTIDNKKYYGINENDYYITYPYSDFGNILGMYNGKEKTKELLKSQTAFDIENSVNVPFMFNYKKSFKTGQTFPTSIENLSNTTNNNVPRIFPAASACYIYNPIGTNRGDWYMPSIAEIIEIFWNINDIQQKLSNIDQNNLLINDVMTINEASPNYYFDINLDGGDIGISQKVFRDWGLYGNNKNIWPIVRPFINLKYDDRKKCWIPQGYTLD